MPNIYYKNYKPNPTGQLTCGGSTVNSITLNFSYTNATTNLGIYSNQALVHIININTSGSGSGSYTVGGLSSATSYTYKLIHGNNVNEQLLAQTQCATLTPPPPPPPDSPGPPPPAPPPSNPPAKQVVILYFFYTEGGPFTGSPTVVQTAGDTQFIIGGDSNVIINDNIYVDGQSNILPGDIYYINTPSFSGAAYVTIIATTVLVISRGTGIPLNLPPLFS